MKKLLLIFATVLVCNFSFSQENTYEIVDDANVSNIEDYVSAMDQADFDHFRLKDKRRQLKFESGVVIELLSAQELAVQGIEFDASKAMDSQDYKPSSSIFKLRGNGYIVELHQSNKKHYPKR